MRKKPAKRSRKRKDFKEKPKRKTMLRLIKDESTQDFTKLLPDEARLSQDLKKAASELKGDEIRYMVDTYYIIQEMRKRCENQIRALSDSGEPHDLLDWVYLRFHTLESQVHKALSAFAEAHPVANWAMQIPGIGPVLTAGLIANIDINQCNTVGKLWAFAGQSPDPKHKWRKGQKRPWNASLKRLTYLIGDCLFKTKGKDNSVYGPLFDHRKEYEQKKNDRLEYREQAAEILRTKNIGKDTDAYKWYSQGKLPPAHIQQRCCRYIAKLFLSHLWEYWYELEFKNPPPKPYPIRVLGHKHYIGRPKRRKGTKEIYINLPDFKDRGRRKKVS